MIQDSHPWKKKLLTDAAIIERWSAKYKSPSRRNFIVENKIFISAYSIRKLFEAGKVCTELHSKPLRCYAFNALHTEQSRWNCHKIDENYDLGNPLEKNISAEAFINQIIHSLAFGIEVDSADKITGFYVASRQGKGKFLFLINIIIYTEFMREIGSDYPDYVHEFHNPADGNYYSVRCCPLHDNRDKFIKI